MSALFDYITGKKTGREVELDASLEHMGGHLGVEMDDNEKLRAEVKRLRAALEPFGRHSHYVSLSEALGHITREDLERAALATADEQ